jgi:hypothetical protein
MSTFVKQVGIEKAYRGRQLGDGQEKTIHLMMVCNESDEGAIQMSPTNYIPETLWNNSNDLWHIHRYKVVDDAPQAFKTIVDW